MSARWIERANGLGLTRGDASEHRSPTVWNREGNYNRVLVEEPRAMERIGLEAQTPETHHIELLADESTIPSDCQDDERHGK